MSPELPKQEVNSWIHANARSRRPCVLSVFRFVSVAHRSFFPLAVWLFIFTYLLYIAVWGSNLVSNYIFQQEWGRVATFYNHIRLKSSQIAEMLLKVSSLMMRDGWGLWISVFWSHFFICLPAVFQHQIGFQRMYSLNALLIRKAADLLQRL